jgi:hypothetical protein
MYKRKLSVNPRVHVIITHAPDSTDHDPPVIPKVIALLTQATTNTTPSESAAGSAK